LIKSFPYILYLYFGSGSGQPGEPALCRLRRHTLVPNIVLPSSGRIVFTVARFKRNCGNGYRPGSDEIGPVAHHQKTQCSLSCRTVRRQRQTEHVVKVVRENGVCPARVDIGPSGRSNGSEGPHRRRGTDRSIAFADGDVKVYRPTFWHRYLSRPNLWPSYQSSVEVLGTCSLQVLDSLSSGYNSEVQTTDRISTSRPQQRPEASTSPSLQWVVLNPHLNMRCWYRREWE